LVFELDQVLDLITVIDRPCKLIAVERQSFSLTIVIELVRCLSLRVNNITGRIFKSMDINTIDEFSRLSLFIDSIKLPRSLQLSRIEIILDKCSLIAFNMFNSHAIIKIEVATGSIINIKVDVKSNRIVNSLQDAHLPSLVRHYWDNGAASHENTLLFIRQFHNEFRMRASPRVLCVPIVPLSRVSIN
jgi:hypothetical protein